MSIGAENVFGLPLMGETRAAVPMRRVIGGDLPNTQKLAATGVETSTPTRKEDLQRSLERKRGRLTQRFEGRRATKRGTNVHPPPRKIPVMLGSELGPYRSRRKVHETPGLRVHDG
jgi:hypothetical protein